MTHIPPEERQSCEVKTRNADMDDAKRLSEIYAYYAENIAVTFEYTVPSILEFQGRIRNTQ